MSLTQHEPKPSTGSASLCYMTSKVAWCMTLPDFATKAARYEVPSSTGTQGLANRQARVCKQTDKGLQTDRQGACKAREGSGRGAGAHTSCCCLNQGRAILVHLHCGTSSFGCRLQLIPLVLWDGTPVHFGLSLAPREGIRPCGTDLQQGSSMYSMECFEEPENDKG